MQFSKITSGKYKQRSLKHVGLHDISGRFFKLICGCTIAKQVNHSIAETALLDILGRLTTLWGINAISANFKMR